MNSNLRRRFEMAVRVRDFLQTHTLDAVGENAAVERLQQLIDRAQTLSNQQIRGLAATRAATEHRQGARDMVERKLLMYLAGVGAVAAKQDPELAARFRMPAGHPSHQGLVNLARAMLEQATANKDLLVSSGMSATLLDDLSSALAELEKTLEESRAGRVDHVGASAEMKSVAQEISAQVRLLHGLVRYRFRNNPDLLGAWASVRNVVGPFRPHTPVSGTPDGNGGTPAGSGDTPAIVAPAAQDGNEKAA